MSLYSAAGLQRKAEHLYQSPSDRRDVCAHCKNSTVTMTARGEKQYRCRVMREPVGAGGNCAIWAPVRRYIELAPWAA